MEEYSKNFRDRLEFTGQGVDLFKIYIVNAILTLITLGIYYPWAKANYMKFNYNNTVFKDSPFEFHGTGWEMFKGAIKMILFLIIIFIVFFAIMAILAIMTTYTPFAIIVIYPILLCSTFALIAFAIYGALRYRASRSSWRGIFFQYEDDVRDFIWMYIGNMFLTIMTFGIYGSWATCKLLKRYANNLRFGNASFEFVGEGKDLFFINLKGIILSIITLGIYMPFFIANTMNFYFNNTDIHQNNKTSSLRSDIQGSELLVNGILYGLLTMITLGLAYPWLTTAMSKLVVNNIWIEGEIDFDTLSQKDVKSGSAMGESMFDYLDGSII